MKVYEATVHPHHGGFGMYEMGEPCVVEGVESEEQWCLLANENGYNVREAGEFNGKVYGQNGATIYAIAPYDPKNGKTREDEQSFYAVWEVDE